MDQVVVFMGRVALEDSTDISCPPIVDLNQLMWTEYVMCFRQKKAQVFRLFLKLVN